MCKKNRQEKLSNYLKGCVFLVRFHRVRHSEIRCQGIRCGRLRCKESGAVGSEVKAQTQQDQMPEISRSDAIG